MALSQFGPRRRFIATSKNPLVENNFYALGGLDLYSPDEVMKDSSSPFARNFRVYNHQKLENRVAISKRNGHTKYSDVVDEAKNTEQASVTGASDVKFGNITWVAQKFVPSATKGLSKVSIRLKNTDSGTAPIIITIHKDNSGNPGEIIATSSISQASVTGTYAYLDALFIEAPSLTSGTTYWIVLHQQSEGTGLYSISTTTTATNAKVSTSAGNTWTAAAYDINFQTYLAPVGGVIAVHRYYRTTAAPETIFVATNNTGVGLYKVNDSTGAVTQITVTLSSSATNYEFVNVDNKCYFVNGVDNPKVYNGTTVSDMGGSPGVCISIRLHKQALFLLNSTNKVIYSTPSALETFDATAYIYVPAPNTADYVVYMETFQDNLVLATRKTKYVLYGQDINSFVLRESTSVKGVVGPKAAFKSESLIYFVSDDFNVYAYNGGTDKAIGTNIMRQLQNASDITKSILIVENGQLRVYYTPSGSSQPINCLIDNLDYYQWGQDTDIYVSCGKVFSSQTDTNQFVVGSSRVSRLMLADKGGSDIGKPILFDYWTKYFSFGHPSRKHRIKRLYPMFKPGEGKYYANVDIDADYANSPSSNQVYLGTDAASWGSGATWGGGALWGANQLYKPPRINVPGQSSKHQIRFWQYGVDNPVHVLGFSTYTSMRRPI